MPVELDMTPCPTGESATKVRWAFEPDPGPQTAAYFTPALETLYGGARGGGKTAFIIGGFLPLASMFGDKATGVIFRETYKQLDGIVLDGRRFIDRQGLGEFHRSKDDYSFHFWNGAILKLRHLESVEDCEEYQGHQYCYIGFDEASNFCNPQIFERMRATLRVPYPDLSSLRRIVYTANPGGPCHNYLKDYFRIGVYPKGNVLLKDKLNRTRIYIPAKLTDNTRLRDTEYASELQSITDPVLRAAWLEGSWDIMIGSFFADIWDSKKMIHDIQGNPPAHWPVYRCMDWGSAKPFAVLWGVVTNDDAQWGGRSWPRGALVIFREWYGCEAGKQDVGLRLSAIELGAGITKREKEWGLSSRCLPGPADTSIWTRDGGPSHYDLIMEGSENEAKANGGKKIDFIPAFKDRRSGWEEMRSRMKGNPDTGPLLMFTTNAEACIRTIPTLIRDKVKLEDIDTSQEDHAADALRYLVNSFRRGPRSKDELIARTQREPLDKVFGY